MKTLSLALLAATSVSTTQAQDYRKYYTEPQFSAPSIPETNGIYTRDQKDLGCAVDKKSKALTRCSFKTEAGEGRMNTLILQGSLYSIAYEHGRVMAQEIENGSLVEALNNLEGMKLNFGKTKGSTIYNTVDELLKCYTNRIKRSVDLEFQEATRALANGYFAGMKEIGKTPKYTIEKIEEATYSIELGNIFAAMFDNLKHKKVATVARVVRECGKPAIKAFFKTGLEKLSEHIEARSVVKNDFACTGAIVPKSASKDGFLYHARNLEQTSMIESWNRAPMTFLVKETGWLKYVAFGTAGLIFPGGISGYNEAGISVSTHQMEGTTYDTADKKETEELGRYAMGPYLQQLILREARSIDDAIRIAKKYKKFSAWTILVSDANTQESASIEITSEGADISRRRIDKPMGQANHYFLPKNQELQYHESYNAWLENFSRVSVVETILNRAKSGIADILSMMASHTDWFEGERSFGRSVARPMNIMSTITSPKQNKIWVTASDRMPSGQGYYMEMDVDFAKMTLTPKNAIRTKDYESAQDWEDSFSEFQLAYRANHEGGKDEQVLTHLRKALALSNCEIKNDPSKSCVKYDDPAYRYLIARFLLKAGNLDEAIKEFNTLLQYNSNQNGRGLHPLKVANIKSLLFYANGKKDKCKSVGNEACRSYFQDAVGTYQTILAQPKLEASKRSPYFPLAPGDVTQAKRDLEKKLEFLGNLVLGKKVKLPGIDMRSMD